MHSTHHELQQSHSLNQKYIQEIQGYKKFLQLADAKDDHRVERLKVEINEMEEMIMKLKQQDQETQREKQSLRQEIHNLTQRNDILRDCLDDIKKELVDCRQQLSLQVEKTQSLESQVQSLSTENYTLQQVSHRAHYELTRYQGNYRAYCRIHHQPSTLLSPDQTNATMITVASNNIMIREDLYPFDRVFEADTSLSQIFDEVGLLPISLLHTFLIDDNVIQMEPSLTSVLYGNKVCFLSYGATTSTKKDEVLIGNHAGESWGIVHLALRRIFDLISSQDSMAKTTKVFLSVLMLCHESDFVDLLASSSPSSEHVIFVSSNHEPSCIECASLEDSYEALENAMNRRFEFDMNDKRNLLTTHLLITINVETVNIMGSTRCEGSLMFVDLANAERVKPTESNAKYFRDCQSNHRQVNS